MVTWEPKLRIVYSKKEHVTPQGACLEEYILSHGDLAREPEGPNGLANAVCFMADLWRQRLEPYRGTFVAYHRGVLCGQSANRDVLWTEASAYYGSSTLAVLHVPVAGEATISFANAVGDFGQDDENLNLILHQSYRR